MHIAHTHIKCTDNTIAKVKTNLNVAIEDAVSNQKIPSSATLKTLSK